MRPNSGVEHFRGYGKQVFGNKRGPRPEKKIERDRTTDDSSLKISGGEMQRAAVARAVITRPDLVLADEPTGNLDSDNGTKVMNLLAELNRELGLIIVLATHSVEAARYARRTLRMRDGSIEEPA